MPEPLKRNLKYPDRTLEIPLGQIQLVELPELTFAYTVLQPEWKWSESIKQTAGTDWCETQHQGFCVSGRLRIQMQDEQMMDIEPGDVFTIPPNHDAWVVGEENFVSYDFGGDMGDYAGLTTH